MGTVQSYVFCAKIPGYTNTSLEWVREDSIAIRACRGRFPSAPGVYYCEITDLNPKTGVARMYVDPLLQVRDERPFLVSASEAVLMNVPYEGSLRLYELPGSILLQPGTDYTIGSDGMTITLTNPLLPKLSLSADYMYPGTATGPWDITPQTGFNRIIPGTVMAFGRGLQKGDRFAVIVSDVREEAYEEYGGKWELSIDIDIIARDVASQQEIADRTAMFLWAQLRPKVINQGIDIQDVSMGGESEEPYDDNGDDYYYNSSLSMTIQADWAYHVPILSRLSTISTNLQILNGPLALKLFQDPFYSYGRGSETIL